MNLQKKSNKHTSELSNDNLLNNELQIDKQNKSNLTNEQREEANELMNILAKSMNAEIVKYKDVDDAISKGISICQLVDSSSYLTKQEQEKIRQKYIGL